MVKLLHEWQFPALRALWQHCNQESKILGWNARQELSERSTGLKAELKNRVMYVSLCRMCLLEVCGKHLLVNHSHLATFLAAGKGGRLLRQWSGSCFHCFFGGKGVIWHVAGSQAQGSFSAVHSWLQLSIRSLRTGCSPKVVEETLTSGAVLLAGCLPNSALVAEG